MLKPEQNGIITVYMDAGDVTGKDYSSGTNTYFATEAECEKLNKALIAAGWTNNSILSHEFSRSGIFMTVQFSVPSVMTADQIVVDIDGEIDAITEGHD